MEPDYRQGGGRIQLRPDSAEAGAIGPTRCRGQIVSQTHVGRSRTKLDGSRPDGSRPDGSRPDGAEAG